VPHALEAARQHVLHEAREEIDGIDAKDALLVAVS
jgi:hypothetical protein